MAGAESQASIAGGRGESVTVPCFAASACNHTSLARVACNSRLPGLIGSAASETLVGWWGRREQLKGTVLHGGRGRGQLGRARRTIASFPVCVRACICMNRCRSMTARAVAVFWANPAPTAAGVYRPTDVDKCTRGRTRRRRKASGPWPCRDSASTCTQKRLCGVRSISGVGAHSTRLDLSTHPPAPGLPQPTGMRERRGI